MAAGCLPARSSRWWSDCIQLTCRQEARRLCKDLTRHTRQDTGSLWWHTSATQAHHLLLHSTEEERNAPAAELLSWSTWTIERSAQASLLPSGAKQAACTCALPALLTVASLRGRPGAPSCCPSCFALVPACHQQQIQLSPYSIHVADVADESWVSRACASLTASESWKQFDGRQITLARTCGISSGSSQTSSASLLQLRSRLQGCAAVLATLADSTGGSGSLQTSFGRSCTAKLCQQVPAWVPAECSLQHLD